MYRKVVDVTNVEEEYPFPEINNLHNNYHEGNRAGNDEDEDDNLDITTAAVQANIHSRQVLTDGPEIFKRIRFLSRWENDAESRGYRLKEFRGWSISTRHNVARMARFQILVSVAAQLIFHKHWIYAGVERKSPLTRWCAVMAFIGVNRAKSVPVIILMSLSKKVRRRCSEVLKLLGWLGKGSRIPVIFGHPATFGMTEERKESVDTRVIETAKRFLSSRLT